jgi:predicted double-glycine peptidase
MQPWFEAIGVFILAVVGVFLGLLTQRLKKHYMLICYLPPLILILLIALTRHIYWLVFYPPFSWITEGRREYAIFAFTIPMIFSILIPKLPIRRQKIVLSIFVLVTSIVFFIIPFISPIIVRSELEKLDTTVSDEGICLQSTSYTCGPASAVTALHQLGIIADEGKLAILAYTSPQTGTSDDLLKKAIEKLYGPEGIICTYKCFNSIDELKDNCPAIVVTKHSFLIDHYVTVLGVTKTKVIIGDPSIKKEILTREEFADRWRSVGIVVKRVQNNE